MREVSFDIAEDGRLRGFVNIWGDYIETIEHWNEFVTTGIFPKNDYITLDKSINDAESITDNPVTLAICRKLRQVRDEVKSGVYKHPREWVISESEVLP